MQNGIRLQADVQHCTTDRIARLEASLAIQEQGLAGDLAKLTDTSLSDMDQAWIEASVYFTRKDIADLHAQIDRLRSELAREASVLERFPASHPRGSWPAEEFAAARRAEGIHATVVQDIRTDEFLVVKAGS